MNCLLDRQIPNGMRMNIFPAARFDTAGQALPYQPYQPRLRPRGKMRMNRACPSVCDVEVKRRDL